VNDADASPSQLVRARVRLLPWRRRGPCAQGRRSRPLR
jgi:hypothetical protein